jgi:hypothetical protein
MGGNALKKVKASRISLNHYNLIKKDILRSLENYVDIIFPFESPNKIDFGDIDVLYKHRGDNFILQNLIKEIYNTPEIVTNGSVISFAYPFSKIIDMIDKEDILISQTDTYFQVDLIKTSNLKMASFYFSFGDLGNIIGRITKNYNIKFGDGGLFLKINAETIKNYYDLTNLAYPVGTNKKPIPFTSLENFNEILLSTNPKEICEYLQLDYDLYGSEHFTSYEKIFEWIIVTPLFKKEIFTHLNYEHRHKSTTRPMYKKFLEHIGVGLDNDGLDNDGLDNDRLDNDGLDNGNLNKDHTQANQYNQTKLINSNKQLEALIHFNKLDELKLNIDYQIKKKLRSEKFNGKKLMEFGIKQNEIGKYIQLISNLIVVTYLIDFDIWLDNNDQEYIDNCVKDILSKHKINS